MKCLHLGNMVIPNPVIKLFGVDAYLLIHIPISTDVKLEINYFEIWGSSNLILMIKFRSK